MKNLIDLLIGLVHLAASLEVKAQASPELVAAIANLIKYIKDQSGLTTDEILERAGGTLDAGERMLLEDQVRLAADLGGDETKTGY